MSEIVGFMFLFVGGQEGGGRLIEEEDTRKGNVREILSLFKKINSEFSLN